jgi:hypothetical protein
MSPRTAKIRSPHTQSDPGHVETGAREVERAGLGLPGARDIGLYIHFIGQNLQ